MKLNNNRKLFIIFVFLSMNILILSVYASDNQFLNIGGQVNVKVLDTVKPIISEVVHPKNYFISQSQEINLLFYATAYDNKDGNITSKIVVSSIPEFDSTKAGNYQITYNVKDRSGNAADPLMINILIWDFVKIRSGNYHTLALTSHGHVYSWGYNASGQLGDGTTNYNSTPTMIKNLDNIIDIAASASSSFALKSDGQLYSWGDNTNGILGDNTITRKTKPTKVTQPSDIEFTQVSARFYNVAALTTEGDVYTWGYADYGSAGTNASEESHIPIKINLTNIKQISMGFYNGVAVSNDGMVYTWGDNYHGQLGIGKTPSISTNPIAQVPYFKTNNIEISQASAGWYHMLAVAKDGKLYSWGYGAEGRLGHNSNSDSNIPINIPLPTQAVEVQAGYYHSGVRTIEDSIYFFGQNSYGKHGIDNTTNHLTPYLNHNLIDVKGLSLALDSSFVLIANQDVYGMGYGGTGVLGTGNSIDSLTPKKWFFIPVDPY